MRLPNLNSLRMFDSAARHLNFRLAAEELHLTQGAVAQQVRRLEADLGHKLFYREARGLRLTDAGRSYQAPVRQAMDLIEQATRKLRPEEEQVTLSVPPSLASKWLVPRLPQFERDNPALQLRIVAEERLTDFTRDGFDIAIRQGGAPQEPGSRSACLSLLNLVAVAATELARDLPETPGLPDLIRFTLIQDGHRHWEHLLQQDGLKPAGRVLQFNQTSLAMDAAQNGQGIALVPKIFVADQPLHIVWQAPPMNDLGFYVVWPDRKNPARDRVADWLLSA
jgi:LysR family transcriptional regulator, glycine cleavage system transcriptional activator